MHIEVRSPRGERERVEDRVTEGRKGEHGERERERGRGNREKRLYESKSKNIVCLLWQHI